MSITKHPEEFEKQVVREVPEKARTIDSTMTSYDLVPQIVKACIVKCGKRCAGVRDIGTVESVAVIKLGAVKVGEKYVSGIRRDSFYNEHVVVSSVPKSARNCLDSCSASGWLISRYWVMADEVSGIVNDFNDWVVEGTGNVSTVLTRPSCLLDLITCATNISIQAQQIVGSLPKLMVET